MKSTYLPLHIRLLSKLPPSARRTAQWILWLPIDLLDSLSGRRPDYVPPRGIADVGMGDFLEVGSEFRRLFTEHGYLTPRDRVLDIGCGVGRIAVAMGGFLDGGTYDGFDVVEADIRWCRRHLVKQFPQLRFRHVDVSNTRYNPGGRIRAEDFEFPYPDQSFDFVIATSVFTHLLAPTAEHYLREIARVLAPGGRAFLTAFLLDGDARRLIEAGHCGLHFRYQVGEAFVQNESVPEEAVAFDVAWIRSRIEASGLTVATLQPGAWPGRAAAPTYQDVLVAGLAPDAVVATTSRRVV